MECDLDPMLTYMLPHSAAGPSASMFDTDIPIELLAPNCSPSPLHQYLTANQMVSGGLISIGCFQLYCVEIWVTTHHQEGTHPLHSVMSAAAQLFGLSRPSP